MNLPIEPTDLQQAMMSDYIEQVTIVATGACVGKSVGLLLKALATYKEHVYIVHSSYHYASGSFINAINFLRGSEVNCESRNMHLTVGRKHIYFVSGVDKVVGEDRRGVLILVDEAQSQTHDTIVDILQCGVETVFTSNPYDSSKLHWDYNNENRVGFLRSL